VTQYLDSSALLAVLMDEPTADVIGAALAADADWVTGRHTYVEVRRTIAGSVASERIDAARATFADYWARTTIIELDQPLCALAADLAERTRLRTRDALHLAAARHAAGDEVTILTLDHRLRDAAQALGMSTRGADAVDPPSPAT